MKPDRIAIPTESGLGASRVDGVLSTDVDGSMSEWLPFEAEVSDAATVDVFAFPHAGASADVFRNLRPLLPAWIALRPLELPGRGRRMLEDATWTLEPLVAVLASELERVAARPAVFFGHSMGALLAFETARRLRPPHGPRHLVVSGHRGPQLDRSYLTGHEDDDATFARELRRWGGDAGGWLDDGDLRDLFLPVLRADFRALVAYRFTPGDPLTCPITAVRGIDDPYLDEPGLEAWRELTRVTFEARTAPGGHFFWVGHPERIAPILEAAARTACAQPAS